MEACKQSITIKYVRLPGLLLDLDAAREAGNFQKVLSKYTKPRYRLNTTNATESLNATYRKSNHQRSVFPNDTALLRALYLSTFEAIQKVNIADTQLGPGLWRIKHYV